MTDKLAKQIAKIFLEHDVSNNNKTHIHADYRYDDDFGLDCLEILVLIMSFEDEFNVEIPDDAAAELVTFSEVYSFLCEAKAVPVNKNIYLNGISTEGL